MTIPCRTCPYKKQLLKMVEQLLAMTRNGYESLERRSIREEYEQIRVPASVVSYARRPRRSPAAPGVRTAVTPASKKRKQH